MNTFKVEPHSYANLSSKMALPTSINSTFNLSWLKKKVHKSLAIYSKIALSSTQTSS